MRRSRPHSGVATGKWTLVAGLFFFAATGCIALHAHRPALAVYALSFWHYLVYGLAYFFRAVPLAVFRRDAVILKTVALLALGITYFSVPITLTSLAVTASGFLLNCTAAYALGSTRTYYGVELGCVLPRRVTDFPYNSMSHPMLIGNLIAFGGTLLNPAFRAAWAPLVMVHLGMNAGLLIMETLTPTPRHVVQQSWLSRQKYAAAGILGTVGLLVAAGEWSDLWAPSGAVFAIGACSTGYAAVLLIAYATPTAAQHARSQGFHAASTSQVNPS